MDEAPERAKLMPEYICGGCMATIVPDVFEERTRSHTRVTEIETAHGTIEKVVHLCGPLRPKGSPEP